MAFEYKALVIKLSNPTNQILHSICLRQDSTLSVGADISGHRSSGNWEDIDRW